MLQDTIAEKIAERKAHAGQNGQIVAERLLLYLRCLDFPAEQALDFALRALKEAGQNGGGGPGSSQVAEAVQTLRDLLREQKAEVKDLSQTTGCQLAAVSTPPIHRLPMVPQEVAPARIRSMLKKLLGRSRVPGYENKGYLPQDDGSTA